MTKKIFLVIVACVLMALTSTVFAAGELQDSMDKAGANIKNAVEGTGNVIKDGASAVGNGVKDLGDSMKNGVNTTTGAMTANNNDGDTGYTAVRTATDGTFMGMNGTTWTWFILAIAALAIIGVVWYYAMQNSSEYREENNHH